MQPDLPASARANIHRVAQEAVRSSRLFRQFLARQAELLAQGRTDPNATKELIRQYADQAQRTQEVRAVLTEWGVDPGKLGEDPYAGK
jgi:hypothetical protein